MRFSVLILIVPIALVGCHSGVITQPLPAAVMRDDPQAQMEFWHALTGRPVASNDEGFHALLLFIEGRDASADYADRVATMKRRTLIPGDFDRPATGAIGR